MPYYYLEENTTDVLKEIKDMIDTKLDNIIAKLGTGNDYVKQFLDKIQELQLQNQNQIAEIIKLITNAIGYININVNNHNHLKQEFDDLIYKLNNWRIEIDQHVQNVRNGNHNNT